MSRRGRPPGVDSEQTRTSIIDASRQVFATRGYSATTVAALADAAGLAPSAIYHYFGGKAEVYEAVFEETVVAIWSDLGSSARDEPTLVEAVETMLRNSQALGDDRPNYSAFLALVPMEARLHAEFAHLLKRRSAYQDETFGALARRGIETGELDGFTQEEATEIVRSTVMGWFLETYFRGHGGLPVSSRAIISLFRRLAETTEQVD